MPSKNTSVISARVKDETAIKLGEIAENRGMTIPKLIEEMVEKYEEEKGVTPMIYEELDTSFGQKVEKRLNKLREREYPERFLESIKEQMLSGLDTQIEMLPKKFNPKRMRNDDWGC